MDFSDIKHLASDDTQVIHDRVIETSSGLARNKLLGVFLFLIRALFPQFSLYRQCSFIKPQRKSTHHCNALGFVISNHFLF